MFQNRLILDRGTSKYVMFNGILVVVMIHSGDTCVGVFFARLPKMNSQYTKSSFCWDVRWWTPKQASQYTWNPTWEEFYDVWYTTVWDIIVYQEHYNCPYQPSQWTTIWPWLLIVIFWLFHSDQWQLPSLSVFERPQLLEIQISEKLLKIWWS